MKKRTWVVLSIVGLAVCLMLGCYALIRDQKEQETIDYCYQINKIIKDRDFYTAKVTEKGIVLYDRNFNEMEIVPFDSYKRHIKFMGIRKDSGLIYFTLLGSVDDEWGIMFVNDETNIMMEGIHSLERVGGNYYYYDTHQSP